MTPLSGLVRSITIASKYRCGRQNVHLRRVRGRVAGKDMLQLTEKHPYRLIRSLGNDQSKCHLGSSFRFYKLAGSCLLSQHPRLAKLQHLQVFHFMPQIHCYFCKQGFINQLLEHRLLTQTYYAETMSSDPVLWPIRQQDETKSELRVRSSVKDIISTCLTTCDVAFTKSRYALGQFRSKPLWWKVIKAAAITRVTISPTPVPHTGGQCFTSRQRA